MEAPRIRGTAGAAARVAAERSRSHCCVFTHTGIANMNIQGWNTPWLVAVLALTACASLRPTGWEAPYLSLADVRLVELSPFEQRYRFSLRVQNPNPAALRISGLSFELEVNDEVFARGVNDATLVVPAYGERGIHVSATSTTVGLLRQLRKLEQTQTLQYRLKGRVSSPDFPRPMPFDYPGSLTFEEDKDENKGGSPRTGGRSVRAGESPMTPTLAVALRGRHERSLPAAPRRHVPASRAPASRAGASCRGSQARTDQTHGMAA